MNAQSVLQELKEQAQRKAALKMFYAAADVFKEYKGPYAQETAAERAQLADDYEDRARVAENALWGEGSAPPPRRPVTDAPQPTAPRPAPPPKPKVEVPRSTPSPMLVSKAPVAKDVQVQGGQLTFPCRWCKEPITTEVANGGKLIPCPKCDLLVTVPKAGK